MEEDGLVDATSSSSVVSVVASSGAVVENRWLLSSIALLRAL